MATMQGIAGGLSGKMGNVVFRQRYGQTVASQYQPKVTNPNSVAQAENRAAFKLMSQLGAILENVIAIPREGGQSPRNLFTKVNYPLVKRQTIGSDEAAAITITDIQLTKSNRVFNATFDADLDDGTSTATFSNVTEYDKIAVVFMSGFGTIGITERPARVRGSVVVDVQPNGQTFATLNNVSLDNDEKLYVLAYGINITSLGSSTEFENLNTADDVAYLVTSRSVNVGNLQLTTTIGTIADIIS